MFVCCVLIFKRICFCLFLLHTTISARHVVTSTLQLTHLANFERDVLVAARELSLDLPQKFRNFLSLVETEYERHSKTDYVSLPIHQYRLIRRFTFDWPFWKNLVRERVPIFLKRYQELSFKYKQIDLFPPTDLAIAAYSLSCIHLFYGDNARLLPNQESKENSTLTLLEMLELANVTYSHNINAEEDEENDDEEEGEGDGVVINSDLVAQHWLKLFLDNAAKAFPYSSARQKIDYFFKHQDIYGSGEIFAHGKDWNSLETVRNLLEKYPKNLGDFHNTIVRDPLVQTCRAVDRSNASFHCLLFRSPSAPYAPFKLEILCLRPYIALVHNFLPGDTARRLIKSGSESFPQVTGVLNINGTTRQDLSSRLSEGAALHPLMPESRWLDRRIFEATLLSPNSKAKGPPDGEPAQVVNYGVGGFYWEHHDFLQRNSSDDPLLGPWGDRLATVLIYLNDVESGGHTVFPEVGVSVAPRAGRALWWFNLDPLDGSQLQLSLHAACPVNRGAKWAVNKWIRSHRKTGHTRPIL